MINLIINFNSRQIFKIPEINSNLIIIQKIPITIIIIISSSNLKLKKQIKEQIKRYRNKNNIILAKNQIVLRNWHLIIIIISISIKNTQSLKKKFKTILKGTLVTIIC